MLSVDGDGNRGVTGIGVVCADVLRVYPVARVGIGIGLCVVGVCVGAVCVSRTREGIIVVVGVLALVPFVSLVGGGYGAVGELAVTWISCY